MKNSVLVIGAGLAGSEAAWQLVQRGIPVELVEMRPVKPSPAHHTALFAELVCSNSLRAANIENAVGLLKKCAVWDRSSWRRPIRTACRPGSPGCGPHPLQSVYYGPSAASSAGDGPARRSLAAPFGPDLYHRHGTADQSGHDGDYPPDDRRRIFPFPRCRGAYCNQRNRWT